MKDVFYSIRWRLVASYVVLTLLTVSLVGVLALSLVRRYVEQQEITYLTANAEAIAQQAMPLIWPVKRNLELVDLVQTSSFLGNVQVKILDKQKQIISDSGPHTKAGDLLLISPFNDSAFGPSESRIVRFMVLPDQKHSAAVFLSKEMDLPAGASGQPVTIIRRVDGIWGNRLIFEGIPVDVLNSEDTAPAKDIHTPRGADISDGIHIQYPNNISDEADIKSIDFQQVDLLLEEDPASIPQQTITVPIGDKNDPVGYVELSGNSRFGVEAVATTRRAFLWAAGGVATVAVLVGLLVSRDLTAPLRSLADVASQMSSGDLSIRAHVAGGGEIGQLARQFNQMAARLETSFSDLATERDTLRRFIADASHELRTPIATLRNFNELLQGAAAQDLTARQEFLMESRAQINRLEWITHNLLNLSRLEAGLVKLDIAQHDVRDILSTVYTSFKPQADQKAINLSVQYPTDHITVMCDRARFELALSNLMDNAIKFTPAGGYVGLGANQIGQTIRFWVEDTGSGIDPADQSQIFERFYRGQNTQHIAGSGLGLAIVQSTIQAHGGKLEVQSDPGAGSCFVVELSH